MNQETLREPERDLPVVGQYDVVVVGGGIAGVAAAVAAARTKVSVALLERSFGLGGLATLGNVIVYLPLCDGRGHQVIAGIGEELLKLSVRNERAALPAMRVDAGIPPCWARGGSREERQSKRYQTHYNPVTYALELERWVQRQHVTLCYDARFCAVARHADGRIRAVIVETKSGRGAILCGAVVDASGDADVCAAAGEPTAALSSNVRSAWYYYVKRGEIRLECLSKPFDANGRRQPHAGPHYAGDRAAHVTAQTTASRRLIWNSLQRHAEGEDGPVYPILIPTIPCFRMTRRLRGRVELRQADAGRWFDDAVGLTGDWRAAGPVYCIPLRALAGVNTPNLLAAGRCMSAAGRAWDVTRVIPTCAVTGEAAGVAAALAVTQADGHLERLDLASLQAELRRRHVLLDRRLLSA